MNKKVALGLIFGFYFFTPACWAISHEMLYEFNEQLATRIPIDVQARNRLAEVDGFGYKAANLINLEKLCRDFSERVAHVQQGVTPQHMGWDSGAYRLEVPGFVVISSSKIKQFLQQHGVDITVRWQALLQRLFSDPSALEEVREHHRLPEAFFEQLAEQFEHAIKDVFDGLVPSLRGDPDLSVVLHLGSPLEDGLRKLVADAHAHGQRLMVRSSGREDSDVLANAGGNETKANVKTDVTSILQAIKEVLISYFSKKSFMQRVGFGDTHLLEEPLMPVLIQHMIGEVVVGDGEIDPIRCPRCGIMFTEETEGSLAKIQAISGARTSGITIIQASYGHNEGVVSSIVPADTYYIDSLGGLYSVIRPKEFRLIPDEASGRLRRSPPILPSIARAEALDSDALMTLKLLATFLEHCYQRPMDVEFVVDAARRTIAIVQARPIIHNTTVTRPSCLKDPQIALKMPVKVIGSAGGQLRLIRVKDCCIIQKNIREALAVYQHQTTDREMVECIIIEEDAHATSHEVTTFRGELKPVVVVENYREVEYWLNSAQKVVVDVQQGFVAQWVGPENSVEEIVASGQAVLGWIRYPIPFHMTLASIAILKKKLPIEVDEDRLLKIKLAAAIDILYTKFPGLDIDRRQLEIDLDDLRIRPHEANFFLKLNLFNVINNILETHHKMFPEHDVVDWGTISVDRKLKLLFHLHFLHAICTQIHTPQVVRSYSLEERRKELEAEERSQHILGEPPVLTDDVNLALRKQREQYAKLAASSLSDDLTHDWISFVRQMRFAGDENQQKAHSLFAQLERLDMLELWLHTSFARCAKKTDALDQILAEGMHKPTSVFLEHLEQKKKKLQQLQLDGVVDPTKFMKIWDDFNSNVLSYFIAPEPNGFIYEFVRSNVLGKLAALNVMAVLVEKFDTAIKDMRSSKKYKIVTRPTGRLVGERITVDCDQLFTFKVMLQKYLELLQVWYGLLEQSGVSLPAYGIYAGQSMGRPVPVREVLLDEVPQLLANFSTTDEHSLLVGKEFNVASSIIGSGAGWSRALPGSLEDCFAFVHQSLLTIIKNLTQKYGLGPEQPFVPQVIKDLHAKVSELVFTFEGSHHPEHTGTVFKDNSLVFIYNWLQRIHSASVRIGYERDPHDGRHVKLIVRASIFGYDHNARWERMYDVFTVFNKMAHLKAEILASEKGFAVQWEKKLPIGEISSQDAIDFDRMMSAIQGLADNASAMNAFTFNVVPSEAKFIFDLAGDRVLFAELILELYAHHDRMGFLLFPALQFLTFDLLERSPRLGVLLDYVLTIFEQLIDRTKPYEVNSEIFLHFTRQPKRDDLFLNGENYHEHRKLMVGDYFRSRMVVITAACLLLEALVRHQAALGGGLRNRLCIALQRWLDVSNNPLKKFKEIDLDKFVCGKMVPRFTDIIRASTQYEVISALLGRLGGVLHDTGTTIAHLFSEILSRAPIINNERGTMLVFNLGEIYLARFIDLRLFSVPDSLGKTPLHFAVAYDRHHYLTHIYEILAEAVSVQISIAAKVAILNPPDNFSETPLHTAAGKGFVNMVSDIVEKIEVVAPDQLEEYLNPRNRFGQTPFNVAEMCGHADVSEYLKQQLPSLRDVGLPQEDEERVETIMVGGPSS